MSDAACPRCKQPCSERDAWRDGAAWHAECLALRAHEDARAHFGAVLIGVGLDPGSLRAIPNRYGSGDRLGPWFLFETRIGDMRIGWRNSVIEIEWQGAPDGLEIFANWYGTKAPNLVHANSYDDAAECLRMIASAAPLPAADIEAIARATWPGVRWSAIIPLRG